ncbi:MAG: tetratricopeptide repeat protein [Candidatus Brocadiaceae bacterium]|nr:tetratricopeptide repeat protein [Candidatus Brocadiaceae bacterium]
MIKFRTKLRIFLIPLACTLLIGWIDPASDMNEEGIRLYKEKSYDEAISKFTDAQLNLPKSDVLNFNIANTHFQEGKLPEAEKAYQNALRSKDSALKAKANYNMGNTLYKQGKLNEALDFYKKAIELTGDKADKENDEIKEDAKYNYEFVQKKMEEMKQEQQERQDQEEQEEEDKEEENKQEEQKQGDKPPEEEKEPEDQEQKKQEEEQQQQKKDEEKEDKGNQSGQQKEQPPEEEKEEPQPQEKKEMTKEEAERILEALKQSEESAREMKEKENESAQFGTEKNW